MATYKLYVQQGTQYKEIQADSNKSFLEALRNNGFSDVHAPCGGNATCKQCEIIVRGEYRNINKCEVKTAYDSPVLSCCNAPASDCQVILSVSKKMEVLTKGANDIAPCGEGLGVAVDIGTTTVAVYLYDLETGKRLEVESDRNAQRCFGADVISRIQVSAEDGGLQKLRDAVRNQISNAIDLCCAKVKRNRNEIERISIAGNTVMEHILMDLSPVTIGVAPFKTLSLFGETTDASEIFYGLAPNAELYLAPALAAYVGGDITAGLLSSGAYKAENPCLFIDIGTNGEMGIGDKNGFLCCATAAGPAFEGAEIECGTDASIGAISGVSYVDEKFKIETLGDVEASGICGSGLIDAIYAMLRSGVIEENGRMIDKDDAKPSLAEGLQPTEDKKKRFFLAEKVYVSATDIRQIQMAKASIRAGIETLLHRKNLKYKDLKHVIIAGGFGAHMDTRSGCGIGLLPPEVLEKTYHAGNTAGGGAALTLDREARELLGKITEKCEYIELSGDDFFMEKYIECMIFDEYDEV